MLSTDWGKLLDLCNTFLKEQLNFTLLLGNKVAELLQKILFHKKI
jgi:hypothetical protein